MSKRTKRVTFSPNDWHPTPLAAITPLLRALPAGSPFVEPCAGDGRLAQALVAAGHVCIAQSDLNPRSPEIKTANALEMRPPAPVITNPPFAKVLLQPLLNWWIIDNNPTCWLLLPSDMICNLWTAPYMPHLFEFIPIGRVSWQENGTGGYENFAWFRFGNQPAGFIHERLKK